jgi:hypothetical protein
MGQLKYSDMSGILAFHFVSVEGTTLRSRTLKRKEKEEEENKGKRRKP